MVSLCWGVCTASRWRHRATVPAYRHACARNTVTLQLKDGGYALLWKRYNNNNMAAVADVLYIFNSTVVDWTCFMFFFVAERTCLLRGTDWVFPRYSGSCFVFSGFTIAVSFADTRPLISRTAYSSSRLLQSSNLLTFSHHASYT